MLEELKFVQGAVARKSYVQALTHFHINKGTVIGSNGMITLCSPIDIDIDFKPKASSFIKAIQTCSSTVQLSMTASNKLYVKSGNFKAYVECTEEDYPVLLPHGKKIEVGGGFLDAIRVLEKFVAEDDSRKWARGVLFSGYSAYATNNVILAEYWLGYEFPETVCIPDQALQEILRIGIEPIAIQVAANALTFHYPEGRWLQSHTYANPWPPVSELLDKTCATTLNQRPITDEAFKALVDITPFTDELNRVYLSENRIATGEQDEAAATVDVHLADKGIYNVNQLRLLEGVIETIDLSTYPNPSPFFGTNLRGLIVGMKE